MGHTNAFLRCAHFLSFPEKLPSIECLLPAFLSFFPALPTHHIYENTHLLLSYLPLPSSSFLHPCWVIICCSPSSSFLLPLSRYFKLRMKLMNGMKERGEERDGLGGRGTGVSEWSLSRLALLFRRVRRRKRRGHRLTMH